MNRSSGAVQVLISLAVFAGLAVIARAEGIGFRNDTKGPVIVQGISVVNNMPRRGLPLLIQPGRIALEVNVPSGPRLLTIYDGTNPSRVLLRDQPVLLQGRDLFFSIKPAGKDRVNLAPEQGP